ncbi:hypothetical protein [Allokutzneria multivorans]|uniref:hypothetical protein n=1 Tax=Allokutzneria multivorans TaxID=1142134 RepID=UPI0031ECDDC4
MESDGPVLREMASAVRQLGGEANTYREAVEDAGARLSVAWAGTRRHEPATAIAYAAEAVRKIGEGMDRLHRAATCSEEAVGGATWP